MFAAEAAATLPLVQLLFFFARMGFVSHEAAQDRASYQCMEKSCWLQA